MPRGKTARSLELIAACRDMLAELQPASVRAVCYRLFVGGLIGSMSKGETNRVSRQLVYAREAGLIPWNWIVDETREAERPGTWTDPTDYAAAVQASYRRDHWAYQRQRCEVWSEKGTVRGTLQPVLREYGVTFRVGHGYASATMAREIADETAGLAVPLRVYYVGDHDPSGLHMSVVDWPRRLAEYGARVELVRLALTAADTADPTLPGFPAADKRADPRYGWYIAQYGGRCWELDALSPVTLRERLREAIRGLIDWPAWQRCARAEAAECASLVDVLGAWRTAIAMPATE
jgi:hypothetical protein